MMLTRVEVLRQDLLSQANPTDREVQTQLRSDRERDLTSLRSFPMNHTRNVFALKEFYIQFWEVVHWQF